MVKTMYVDIFLFDKKDEQSKVILQKTALHLYDTKYKQEGLSLVLDFESGLVNFANEKECKIKDKQDLYYFLENLGYEVLHTAAVQGKISVY